MAILGPQYGETQFHTVPLHLRLADVKPERIQGKPYSIRADVWSLGLTLHEIAHLRFPFPPEGENEYVAPIELLSYIVTAPVPEMVDDESVGRVWSDAIKNFMKLWYVPNLTVPLRNEGELKATVLYVAGQNGRILVNYYNILSS